MALFERLAGTEEPKVPIHQFQALAAEWARGNLTGVQANAAIASLTGAALDAEASTEAQNLVNTVPTGNTTANQAARALRLLEIDQVLLLLDVAIYTPAQARTRLGL